MTYHPVGTFGAEARTHLPSEQGEVGPLGYTRKRLSTFYESEGVETHTPTTTGSVPSEQISDMFIIGKEQTTSHRTAWNARNRLLRSSRVPPETKARLRRMNFGGFFINTKNTYSEWSPSSGIAPYKAGGFWVSYRGRRFARDYNVGPTSSLWPQVVAPTILESNFYGAAAIKATIPTNPTADVAQFIGELREGIPVLSSRLSSSTGFLQKSADKYLEYEFAIKPFISDIRNIIDTQHEYDKHLNQLERDSGKLIRRKMRFPVIRSSTDTIVSSNWYSQPPLYGQPSSTKGVLTKTRISTEEWWFSGAYQYYFKRHNPAKKYDLQNLDQLYGLKPSLYLGWELSPWSWAADWLANTGTILSNVRALQSDSLILRYGYIMCHKVVTDTYTLNTPSGTFIQSFSTELKLRRRATPYGFGLNPNTFSPRQWAILAALGITRGGPNQWDNQV